MILWINGAFGAGKSQNAYELQRRVPNAFADVPERVGSFMMRNIPPEARHCLVFRTMPYGAGLIWIC